MGELPRAELDLRAICTGAIRAWSQTLSMLRLKDWAAQRCKHPRLDMKCATM